MGDARLPLKTARRQVRALSVWLRLNLSPCHLSLAACLAGVHANGAYYARPGIFELFHILIDPPFLLRLFTSSAFSSCIRAEFYGRTRGSLITGNRKIHSSKPRGSNGFRAIEIIRAAAVVLSHGCRACGVATRISAPLTAGAGVRKTRIRVEIVSPGALELDGIVST